MAAQGGIAPAHQQPGAGAGFAWYLADGPPQSPADGRHPLRRLLRLERPGVAEQEQQGRGVTQGPPEGGGIPAQQQGTAMHRLGSGGVVIQDDDLQSSGCGGGPGGHGTIVP